MQEDQKKFNREKGGIKKKLRSKAPTCSPTPPPHTKVFMNTPQGEKMNQYDVIGEIPSSLGIPPFPMYYKHGLFIGIYHLYGSYDVLLEIQRKCKLKSFECWPNQIMQIGANFGLARRQKKYQQLYGTRLLFVCHGKVKSYLSFSVSCRRAYKQGTNVN